MRTINFYYIYLQSRASTKEIVTFTQRGKREILSHQKNFSTNQFFSNLFSKTVTFTKFLPKIREREFQ